MVIACTVPGFFWVPQPSGTTASMRGVHAVNPHVVWASGTNGTYLQTTDGTTWHAGAVPEAESLDFRGVHAVDARTAYLLSAGRGPSKPRPSATTARARAYSRLPSPTRSTESR